MSVTSKHENNGNESSRHVGRRAVRRGCFLAMASMALVTTLLEGCASHIHNAADSKKALAAQAQFEELSKAHNEVFIAMTSNLDTLSKAEADMFREIRGRETEIRTRWILRQNWAELRAQLTQLPTEMETELDELATQVTLELGSAKTARVNAAAALESAGGQLEAAKVNLTRWNRRIGMLEALITVTPELFEVNADNDYKDFKESIGEMQKTLGSAKFEYTDADGNTQSATIADELKDLDVSVVLGKGDASLGRLVSTLQEAFNEGTPGLALTIASLAKDLAETEHNAAVARIQSIQNRQQLLDRANTIVNRSAELATEARTSLNSSETVFADDDEIRLTLLAVSGSPASDSGELKDFLRLRPNLKKSEKDLQFAALALQDYANIVWESGELDEIRRGYAVLKHRQSIHQSQLNTAIHEALVRRGIEGLVSYHSGGVKPQEVAELAYRVTQLILLGLIAAN